MVAQKRGAAMSSDIGDPPDYADGDHGDPEGCLVFFAFVAMVIVLVLIAVAVSGKPSGPAATQPAWQPNLKLKQP